MDDFCLVVADVLLCLQQFGRRHKTWTCAFAVVDGFRLGSAFTIVQVLSFQHPSHAACEVTARAHETLTIPLISLCIQLSLGILGVIATAIADATSNAVLARSFKGCLLLN